MPKPYRNSGRAKIDWNIKDFKSEISVDGTLNNPEDIDKSWTVEVAIPFMSLTENREYVMPGNGSCWKINFSRVQWQTEVIDGKYQRIKDIKTNKFLSENNWVWSAQGVINMHFPERWGLVQFSSYLVGNNVTDFQIPKQEEFGKYLWSVYYKQQKHKRETGKYANFLSELGLSPSSKTENGDSIFYEMKAENKRFAVIMKVENELKLSLNQDGLFQILNK